MNEYKPGLYPSLFAAPQLAIKDAIDAVDQHVQGWHFDVMDLSTVHNIALNFSLLQELQTITRKPVFIHLMVNLPVMVLPLLTLKKGDIIALHAHRLDLGLLLPAIKKAECSAFLVINHDEPVSLVEPYLEDIDGILLMGVRPGFSGQKPAVDIVQRVQEARVLLQELGRVPQLAVDGGVTVATAPQLYEAGATMLVVGSALFGGGSVQENARLLAAR